MLRYIHGYINMVENLITYMSCCFTTTTAPIPPNAAYFSRAWLDDRANYMDAFGLRWIGELSMD